ncbi:MAG: succinate dehydrogenase, cytochrome b556 subunit [Microvirga sp.]|nr:succinate dehydrogenase, cytochrome b556 subunit [Microvirga sp.]
MAQAELRKGQPQRPLSPHLQIYRWTWTMAMSVVHRITGVALYLGTAILAVWLVAMASGPDAYASAQWLLGSWFGIAILFGYTWALTHHMLGGLRHFIWDFGKGFGDEHRFLLAKATLAGSVALTILIWVVAFAAR